jgi:hypothetical protein
MESPFASQVIGIDRKILECITFTGSHTRLSVKALLYRMKAFSFDFRFY